MKREELNIILEKHKKFLRNEADGERANLRGANLYGADLYGANLCGANLCGADLYGANLCGANLYGADLRGANLYGADLRGANLYGADLRGADLRGADLFGADLRGANLYGADLRGADLRGADLFGANLCGADLYGAACARYMACPSSGSYIAWKKAHGLIVKLLIPKDAQRSSSTSNKCRADKAIVLAIENIDGTASGVEQIASNYDKDFVYEIGKEVVVDNFNTNRWYECSTGIHHFIDRQAAVDWEG